MNCQDCQRTCIENGGRNLPAACAEHIAGCAGCRNVNERAALVTTLLALKKYEQPDPMFEIRNAAAIRKRLDEEPSFAESLREFFSAQGWRIALAGGVAACLAVIAIQGVSQKNAGSNSLATQGPAPVIQPQTQPDPNDPAWRKPMFVIQDSSVGTPSGPTQFGESNRASQAVDFTAPGPLHQR